MKKKVMENEESDENEVDDPSEPEELQNNGTDDDWSPTPEAKGGRRTSGRAKTQKRSYEDEESSDEVSDESGGGAGAGGGGGSAARGKRGRGATRGGGRGRGRGGGGRGGGGGSAKKTKKTEEEEEEEGGETSSESDSGETPSEFRSGAYVVLKTDFKTGGDHPIWKIDGKSLLQKFVYEKENEDAEPTYKSTTIYAGWSKSAKESYYPINVEMKLQKGKDQIVTFDRSQIKIEEEKEN